MKLPKPLSTPEETLALHLKAVGLPAPEREYRFHPDREWRADFAWPALKLLVEVEGLTHDGGRHQRVAGYRADLEKYNAAAVMGLTVLRYDQTQVKRGDAVAQIEQVIRARALARDHELFPSKPYEG